VTELGLSKIVKIKKYLNDHEVNRLLLENGFPSDGLDIG